MAVNKVPRRIGSGICDFILVSFFWLRGTICLRVFLGAKVVGQKIDIMRRRDEARGGHAVIWRRSHGIIVQKVGYRVGVNPVVAIRMTVGPTKVLLGPCQEAPESASVVPVHVGAVPAR